MFTRNSKAARLVGAVTTPILLAAGLLVGTATGAQAATTYTSADVAKHASASSCWTVISGNVYDLTAWVNKHPGGPATITAMCGSDGTAAFNGKHSGSATAKATLAGYQIGSFSGSTTGLRGGGSSPSRAIKASTVAKHKSASSCWTVVGNNVYDVTAWIPKHPGGAGAIREMCGRDGTSDFNEEHGRQADAKATLAGYKIGTVTGSRAALRSHGGGAEDDD